MGKIGKNWGTTMPCSSETVCRTKKVDQPWKLPGPRTTTWSEQCLCAVCPVRWSEWGACLIHFNLEVFGGKWPLQ